MKEMPGWGHRGRQGDRAEGTERDGWRLVRSGCFVGQREHRTVGCMLLGQEEVAAGGRWGRGSLRDLGTFLEQMLCSWSTVFTAIHQNSQTSYQQHVLLPEDVPGQTAKAMVVGPLRAQLQRSLGSWSSPRAQAAGPWPALPGHSGARSVPLSGLGPGGTFLCLSDFRWN